MPDDPAQNDRGGCRVCCGVADDVSTLPASDDPRRDAAVRRRREAGEENAEVVSSENSFWHPGDSLGMVLSGADGHAGVFCGGFDRISSDDRGGGDSPGIVSDLRADAERNANMNIIVQAKSGLPIYEQIERQIKEAIVKGELAAGEMLPSIRALAADLKISVITVKRAYEELEQEGMIYSVQGKGFYVDNPDIAYMKEKLTLGIEERLAEWVSAARASGMTKEEAADMLDILWE